MQTSNLIDDEKQWEIEEIVDKIEDKKSIWYKMKWLDWDLEYFSYSKSLSSLDFANSSFHLKLFSFDIFKSLYINNHDI